MKIKWTSRFGTAYKKESIIMQTFIVQAVHKFQMRYKEDKKRFIATYDRVQGLWNLNKDFQGREKDYIIQEGCCVFLSQGQRTASLYLELINNTV